MPRCSTSSPSQHACNHFFRENKLADAERKYKKALKYMTVLRESMGSSSEGAKIREVEVP